MFEREAGYITTHDDLPKNIINMFIDSKKRVRNKSLLSWSEHCTECAIPFCYQTCSFYQPRLDLKCRRFPDGFSQIPFKNTSITADYLLKVLFGKWAKLEALGSTKLFSIEQADKKEILDQLINRCIEIFPLPYYFKIKARRLLYSFKKKQASYTSSIFPQHFMLEVYNPAVKTVQIKLSIYNHVNPRTSTFESLIEITPDYNKHLLSYNSISSIIDLTGPFSIKLELMSAHSSPLYFGIVDFVTIKQPKPTDLRSDTEIANKKIKCVVWDLDNTLWKGTLIEDGLTGLELKSEAVKVIYELERRGILNTIASKNNYDDTIKALQHFGLEDAFIYPQINWDPKSNSIKNIQSTLNIGINTFAFVDDQPFEREEVSSVHPEVAIFTDQQINDILTNSRFDVPITEDAMNRKRMYQQEIERIKTFTSNADDYDSFLKDCNISLTINPLTDNTINRAYELAQRTNQMNFSGNRYTIDELKSLNQKKNFHILLVSANDKFGDYGIVGLAILNFSKNLLEDLMFSCRIQAKKVDHALICHLLNNYNQSGLPLSIKYRESEKNKVAAQIFDEFGFEVSTTDGDTKLLTYPENLPKPMNNIISITDNILNT